MKNRDNEYKLSRVVLGWQEFLRIPGTYEHHLRKNSDNKKLMKFCRIWRRVFKRLNLSPYRRNDLSVLEVGCGGGKYLVQFALNNWRTVGIDCSKEVLNRARNYIEEVSNSCQRNLDTELICGDFMGFNFSEKFDLVFHSGVIEHYLDKDERMSFLRKMFEITKPGGYTVSIVPVTKGADKTNDIVDGCVPAINYTPDLMNQEFKNLNGGEIRIFTHNLFFYFLARREPIIYSINKSLYYILQMIPPDMFSSDFAYKNAGALVGITKKQICKL